MAGRLRSLLGPAARIGLGLSLLIGLIWSGWVWSTGAPVFGCGTSAGALCELLPLYVTVEIGGVALLWSLGGLLRAGWLLHQRRRLLALSWLLDVAAGAGAVCAAWIMAVLHVGFTGSG